MAKSQIEVEVRGIAVVRAVERVLVDLRADLDKRFAGVDAAGDLEKVRVNEQFDFLKERISGLISDAEKARKDIEGFREKNLSDLASSLAALNLRIDDDVADLTDLRELVAKQVELFGNTLQEVSTGLKDQGERLDETAEDVADRSVNLQHEIEQTGARVTRLAEDVDRQVGELAAARTEIAESVQQVSTRVGEDLELLQTTMEASTGELGAELRVEFEARLSGLREPLEELRTKLAEQDHEQRSRLEIGLSNAIANLSGEIKQAQENLSAQLTDAWQGHVTRVKVDLTEKYAEQFADVSRSISEMQRSIETHDTAHAERVDSRADEIASAQQALETRVLERIEDAAAPLVELREAIADQDKTSESLREDITRIGEDLTTRVAKLTDLADLATTVEQHREVAQAGADLAARQVQEIATQQDGVKTALERQIEELATRYAEELTEVRETASDARSQIETILTTIEEVRETAYSDLKDAEGRWSTKAEYLVQHAAEHLQETLTQGAAEARPWVKGGPPYERGTWTQHRGGLWLANAGTLNEPGESDNWTCVVKGLWRVEMITDERGLGVEIRVHDSTGDYVSDRFNAFIPNFLKTWEAGVRYKRGDVITRDGHRWLAIVDGARGDPTKSSDWVLFAMRGPKGARGPEGKPPPMDAILRAYVAYLEEGEGLPIGRFRGGWKFQDRYARSDVVVFDANLMLCVRDNDGERIPGHSPDGSTNTDWVHLYVPPKLQIPPSFVERVNNSSMFLADYVSRQPVLDRTIVNHNGWVMSANKDTTDPAAPQPTGAPSYLLPDTPAWETQAQSAVIYSGMKITFTQGGWIDVPRVHAPTLSATTNYRIIMADITDPDNITYRSIEEPILNLADWTVIAAKQTVVPSGTVMLFYLDSFDQAEQTVITGGWRYDGSSNNAAPGTPGGWNRDLGHSLVRMDKTDLDGTSRETELEGIVPGTTIRYAQADLLANYYEYYIVGAAVDQGTYFEWPCFIVDDQGGPGVGDACTTTITIPTTQSTDYVQVTDHFLVQPSWGTVEGILQFDGVDQPGNENNAFGIDVEFTPADVSPDWDYVSLSASNRATDIKRVAALENRIAKLEASLK